MKLINFRVTNFRNIEDSGVVTLEQVLCLVGKNESGKTAMIEALCGLNPHSTTPVSFERERDYPRRHWLNYRKRHPEEEAVVIETSWRLECPETEAIAAYFGDEALAGDQVTALRRYGSDKIEWRIPLRLRSITEYLMNDENLGYAERRGIGEVKNTRELRSALENLTAPTERQRNLLERLRSLPGKNATLATEQILQLMLPRFMLFTDYPYMASQVRLDNWEERVAKSDPTITHGEKILVEFLNFAGITPNEAIFAASYETLTARCESASNLITQQLATSWSQNRELDVEIRINKADRHDPPPYNHGMVARVRVKDRSNRVSVQLSERSTGLLWFFSFMMSAALLVRRQESLFLILDEPAMALHGAGQEDLLLYIYEYMAPHFQVIYTTHSPFMIASPDNVRLIEVNSASGCAAILTDFAQADSETLLPVQAAGVWNGRGTPGSLALAEAAPAKVGANGLLDDLDLAKRVFSEPAEGIESARPSPPTETESPDSAQPEEPPTVAAAEPLTAVIPSVMQQQLATRPLLLLARLEESLYLSTWSEVLQAQGRAGLDERWLLSPLPQSKGWIEQLAELMPLQDSAETGAPSRRVGAVILRTATHPTVPGQLPSLDLAAVLKREEADIEDVFIPEFYMRILTHAYSLQEADAMSDDEPPIDIVPTRLLPLVETAFNQIAPKGQVFKPEVAAWYLFQHRSLLTDAADSEAEETLERAERLIAAINQLLTPEA